VSAVVRDVVWLWGAAFVVMLVYYGALTLCRLDPTRDYNTGHLGRMPWFIPAAILLYLIRGSGPTSRYRVLFLAVAVAGMVAFAHTIGGYVPPLVGVSVYACGYALTSPLWPNDKSTDWLWRYAAAVGLFAAPLVFFVARSGASGLYPVRDLWPRLSAWVSVGHGEVPRGHSVVQHILYSLVILAITLVPIVDAVATVRAGVSGQPYFGQGNRAGEAACNDT